jgi:recombination protein RecR
MMMHEAPLERLIHLLAKLPGLGPRSARRAALHMIKYRESVMQPLADALRSTAELIKICSQCGNLDTTSPCAICSSAKRDPSVICVVEEVGDLWAIERSNIFTGRYIVLGGTLSALDGRGPDELNISTLIALAALPEVREVILATNATVDGQTTAHYITERLKDCNVTVSRIAHGIPMGGELDYLDDGTLGAALRARQPF